MRGQRQSCRASPGALQHDVLEMIFHELAHARAAVDVRDDLEQEIWYGERDLDGVQVGLAVLVAHRAGRNVRNPACRRAYRPRSAISGWRASSEIPRARARRR